MPINGSLKPNFLLLSTVADASCLQCLKGVLMCAYLPSHADYAWSGVKFAHATWLKVHMVQEVVNLGFNVILSDTDVMWMKDPMAFIARFPEVDMMMSVDDTATGTPANDTGFESVNHPHRNHNTGVYFIRSKDSSK